MEQTPIKVGQNFFAGMTGGVQAGLQMRQANDQFELRNIFATQDINDPAVQQQIMGLDPQTGMQLQDRAAQREDRTYQRGRNAASDARAEKEFELRLAQSAAAMSEVERQQAARRLRASVAPAVVAHRQGPDAFRTFVEQNQQEVAQTLQDLGVDPGSLTYESATSIFSRIDGIAATFETADAMLSKTDATEADREIGRLVSIGVPYDVAVKIKEGAYKTYTDPTTKETIIFDLATRQPVFSVGAQGGSPAPAQGGQQAPASQAEASQPLSFGTRFEGANDAFGLEGFARRSLNFAGDVTGLGQPYPQTSAAQSDFGVLREGLTNNLADAYSGRIPAFLLQGIQNLTPRAGVPFEGPEKAQDKLRALGRSLQEELGNVSREERRPQSPADREALAKRKQALASSMNQVADALDGFKSEDATIPPDVRSRMDAYK